VLARLSISCITASAYGLPCGHDLKCLIADQSFIATQDGLVESCRPLHGFSTIIAPLNLPRPPRLFFRTGQTSRIRGSHGGGAFLRKFSTTPIMTSKWDIQGRSIDLSGKKRLVVVDFDNTCILARSEKTANGSVQNSFAEWESVAQECVRGDYVGLDLR
jgi:hypothetical protein